MDQVELRKLDALQHKLCEDKVIMDGLSLVERGQITGASATLCSLIGKHPSSYQKPTGAGQERMFLMLGIKDKNLWEVVPGEYKVWAGGSSRDLPLSATIALSGK